MKILYVTTVSNTVNAFLIPHIKLLIEQGHQVDVAFNILREVDPELIRIGCKIHKIEFQRKPLKKENYIAYKKMKNLIQNEKYEVVHVHTPIASFLTRLACKGIPNIRIIYTVHGFRFFRGAPLKNWIIYYPIERVAAKWTDAIITINNEDYNSAVNMKLRKSNSVYQVHGVGIELNRFSPSSLEEKKSLRKDYGIKDDDFILFYAAALNYSKHQDLLINVVNVLKDKIPNVKLLLAGDGILRKQYEEKVKKMELQNNVYFLGYRKDIPNLLKISDVVVASSRREGLPVNIMESMAVGLPLVVTNCRGHRDLVRDGENGYLINIEDTQEFINAILKLYQSPELRKKFGAKSIEYSKLYSLETVKEEIKRIYLENL